VPNESVDGAAVRVGDGLAMVTVAVTVGMGDTPLELKVMRQEWLPGIVPVELMDAVEVAGVKLEAGDNVSQPQSEPSVEVNASPEVGLVLLREIV
jgi:hypothetical protein